MITSIAETLNEIGDGNGNISDSAGERSTQFKEDGSDTYGYGRYNCLHSTLYMARVRSLFGIHYDLDNISR